MAELSRVHLLAQLQRVETQNRQLRVFLAVLGCLCSGLVFGGAVTLVYGAVAR